MLTDLITFAALTLNPQGPITTFADSTFANGTWTTTEIVTTAGVGSGTGTQVQAGNPVPAWRSSHAFQAAPFPTTIWAVHTMNAAVYDPAASGAIAQVDFRLDYNTLFNTRAQAALTQGARVYVSLAADWLTGSTGSVWRTRGPDTSVAQDFVELLPSGSYAMSSHPDFTTAGAPITFGFVTGNTSGGSQTLTADWDNFFVGLNGTPASVSVRTGTPPNSDVLRPVSGTGPVIGTTWGPQIDHSTFLPNATLDFLAFAFGQANTHTPHGAVLCGPLQSGYALPAGQPFLFPVPNDLSFLGVTLCLQGGSGDPAQNVFQLTNALDVTIGTY